MQRVVSVLNLFPDIRPKLLLQALNHPAYAPTEPSTAEEAAAPLIDAIVSGGHSLPDELSDLRDALQSEPVQPEAAKPTARSTRANIWNEEALDLSRLKIKEDEDP
jgi:activating signal cointegrator complex subunit 2